MKILNTEGKPREQAAEKRAATDPFEAIHPQVRAPRHRQIASDVDFGGPLTEAKIPTERAHGKQGTIILPKRK